MQSIGNWVSPEITRRRETATYLDARGAVARSVATKKGASILTLEIAWAGGYYRGLDRSGKSSRSAPVIGEEKAVQRSRSLHFLLGRACTRRSKHTESFTRSSSSRPRPVGVLTPAAQSFLGPAFRFHGFCNSIANFPSILD